MSFILITIFFVGFCAFIVAIGRLMKEAEILNPDKLPWIDEYNKRR